MGHEIDQTLGRPAMIYAGETPWHRLGTKIPEEKRRNLDWALEEAGLGFEVVKVAHDARVPDAASPDGFRHVLSKDSFSVVRTDVSSVIGTVGSVWHPLQNGDAFAPLRKVLDDGLATIETGGALRGGANVWLMVRFYREEILRRAFDMIGLPKGGIERSEYEALVDALEREIGGGILPYGFFFNDHSGKGKARVMETIVRVVCANTAALALESQGEGFSLEVAHNSRVKVDYAAATERLFGDLVKRYVKLAAHREILSAHYLPEKPFERIVLERAYPVVHLEEKIRRRDGTGHTETALRKKGEKRNRIRALWQGEGLGITGDGSAWEAYQALIQHVDHDEDAYVGDRVSSLIGGSLGRVKGRVFRDLLDFSTAPSDDAREAILLN